MKMIALGMLCGWITLCAGAAELTWMTDLPKAQAKAKEEKKLVLVDFTGSDWCGWCKKAKKDILDTPEFAEYAKNNLVLVELDFPSAKIEQSAELKKTNKALQNQYGVRGFPTFLLVNGEGKELGRQVGYLEGGPKSFIAKLDGFKK
jgi:protein disulfide-isomerase